MTLDFVFKKATGHDTKYWSERGELDWFDKYADPREDSGKGVLTANWNHFPRAGASEAHRTEQGKADQEFNWGKGRKFQDILERMGYHLEWSDQTSRCDHCYGCITDGPDYYGDSAHSAILGDCDVVCENCIRTDFTEEYLEGLEVTGNVVTGAANIRGIDPAKYGYVKVEGGFENGFHPGQDDDPAKITAKLRDAGVDDPLLFVVDSSGQFDVGFSVWKKPKKYTATFTPQAWINDYAVEVDPEGEVDFDVTAEIAALGSVPKDDTYESDHLREAACAPQWIKEWSGPFYITVAEQA